MTLKRKFKNITKRIINYIKGSISNPSYPLLILIVFVLLIPIIFLLKKTSQGPAFHKTGLFSSWEYQANLPSSNITASAKTESDKAVVDFQYQNSNIQFDYAIKEPSVKQGKNNEITFTSKDKNVQTQYQILPNSLKESIILYQIPSSNEFTSNLKTTNANAYLSTENLPVFLHPQTGKYLFHIQKPYAIDAAGNKTYALSYQLLCSGKPCTYPTSKNKLPLLNKLTELNPSQNYQFVIKLDSQWLNDPKRVLPIIIDPTIVHDTSSEFATGQLNRVKDTTDSKTTLTTPLATGGTITYVDGYAIHTFTSSGTFTPSKALATEVLVVGGGGAGRGNGSNGNSGDGGYGGQVVYNAHYIVNAEATTVTVGDGGIGVANAAGGSGENSVFGTITATGGIGGQNASSTVARRGGDGAGGTGGAGSGSYAGAGGNGLAYPISGSTVYYGGGGGGGFTYGGVGGTGGGGAGETYNTGNATAGTANTGGGGGGVSNGTSIAGKNGGSGIVIVRYYIGFDSTTPSMESYYQELSSDANTTALWHLNENAGTTIADSSDNSNTGTITGATVTAGILGNARSFSGSAQYIEVANSSSLNLTTAGTIELWIYKTTNTNYQMYVTKGHTTEYQLMDYGTTGKISFRWGSDADSLISNSVIPLNTWTHLAGIYDGKQLYIYINGILDNSVTYLTNAVGNTASVRIGARDDTYYNTGSIDEIRISNIARSAEEIRLDASRRPYSVFTSDIIDLTNVSNWNSFSWTGTGFATGDGEIVVPSASSNVVAQWNFNETLGTNAVSGGTCGTSCNGTLTNFADTSGQDIATTLSATGGTITYSGAYTIHTFTSSGTFTPSTAMNVETLVVAGGGGGANSGLTANGGGGGGGVVYNSSLSISAGATTVTVGNGGSPGAPGANGGNSVFSTITAYGGGGGGASSNGASGGCGGGGGAWQSSATGGAGSQGGNGGSTGATAYNGGGGGGGGGNGANGSSWNGGAGGIGYTSSITGSSNYYAGGGGGASRSSVNASGGLGGGGNGGGNPGAPTNATPNTGGGGGGGYGAGTAGASGIVIIRYLNPPPLSGWTAANRRWGAGALVFDGVDDTVNAGNNSAINFDRTSQFSLAAWIKTPGSTGSTDIFNKWDGTNSGYNLNIQSTGTIKFSLFNSSSNQLAVTSSETVDDNNWHYVVVTYDGTAAPTGVHIYIDGRNQSLTTNNNNLTGTTTTTTNLFIGSRNNDSARFVGTIDSASIFSKVLTASEILSNYNSSRVELQTRVGNSSDSNDGTWEAWKPTTNETQIASLDSDSSNWSWNNTSTYMPKSKSDSTVIKQEGTSSLKIQSGIGQTDSNTIALWHLDETGGNGAYIKDSSSNAYNSTPNGTATTDGISAKGRSFNGSTDYINFTGLTWTPTTFSVEFWINPITCTDYNQQVYALNGWSAFMFHTTSTCALYVGTDTTNRFTPTELPANTLALNRWQYFTYTYDGTYGRLYKNGSLLAGPKAQTTSTAWGGFGLSSQINGKIDEVRISNIARSAEEIAENYRAGRDHLLSKTISTSNLSSVTKLPFYIASDRLGTFSQLTIGESPFANYEPDANTAAQWHLDEDTQGNNQIIKFAATNVAAANAYNYWKSLSASTTLATGDSFEYDVYLANNLPAIGGIDLRFSDATYARDVTGWTDQNSIPCHPVQNISTYAYGHWFHRKCAVPAGLNGKTISWINLVNENDTNTAITAYYDNFIVKNSSGAVKATIKTQGAPEFNAVDITNNASNAATPSQSTYSTESISPYDTQGGAYAKDSSGNSNNATPMGTLFIQGKLGKGRYFNGTSDYLTIPNATSLNPSTAITIDYWVKPVTVGMQLNKGVWNEYYTYRKTNGAISLRLFTSAGDLEQYSTSTFDNDGNWHHFAATWSNSDGKIKIYKDGALDVVSSITLTGTINSQSNALTIGAGIDPGGYYFGGFLDEVRISNSVRSADEIRQAYEIGNRTHNITFDFKAKLDSGNLIANSADYSFTVDETAYGSSLVAGHLFLGDKVIIKENYDGTEYLAQGVVNSVNSSTGAVTVTSWDLGSTFPSGGFTVNATVFKWQREYVDLTGSLASHRDAVTRLTYRITDGSQGTNIWLDDLRSSTGYLNNSIGSTITSSPYNRYFQYRTILTQNDLSSSSSGLTSVTLDYKNDQPPSAPTLVTNYLSDKLKTPATTPQIRFSTTDTENNDLVYQVDYDTTSAFTAPTTKTSDTDSGFANVTTPADTSPFNSGDTISYTFPTLTNNTTYFYRIRAKDPNGSNQYSSWSTTRSFTIDTTLSHNQWFETHADQFASDTLTGNAVISSGTNDIQVTSGSVTIDLMEYSSDTAAQTAYVTNAMSAIGGTITTSGLYKIHTFLGNGTFTPSVNGNVEVLVVAGGGGGGTGNVSGGGGAGGLIYQSAFSINAGSTSVTVGNGGAAHTNGQNSTFSTLTAIGGGYGGLAWNNGGSGGCGGGAGAAEDSTIEHWGGAGSQGYRGGNTIGVTDNNGGGAGGGGMGAQGTDSYYNRYGVNGGNGLAYSISGTSTYYCGGGGSVGDAVNSYGSGGAGGGGYGNAGAGTPNTGGGGGGYGGTGGSGIVIIRYLDTTLQSYSESTIKTEGSYSLKGIAKATNSLNQTLTRTITSPIDLSNKNTLSFDIRASRTGSNIKIGLHDSGGTTTEITPSITTADSFQSVTWDLSEVSNVNKDAVDKVVITITNADADNTFYLDNFAYTTSGSGSITSTPITAANIYNASNWQSLTYTDETSANITYQVLYDNAGTPTLIPDSDLPGNSTGLTGNSPISLTTLNTTTYPTIYLRANLSNDLGMAILSDWGVSTNTTPNTPTLISPGIGATNVSLIPSFKTVTTDADADNLQYEVKICTDSDMSTNCQTFTAANTGWSGANVGTSSFSSGTTATYVLQSASALNQNTTYYWKSRAIDPAGSNTWSSTQSAPASFTTLQINMPASCLLEKNDTNTSMKIKWLDQSTNENGFTIQKKTDGGAYSDLINLSAGTTGYTDNTISSGHTYQYQIASYLTGPMYSFWCETPLFNLSTPSPPATNSFLIY